MTEDPNNAPVELNLSQDPPETIKDHKRPLITNITQ